MDTHLRGKQGTFTMNGGWLSQRMKADVYELTNERGTLNVTDTHATVDVERSTYGGGTIAAHYLLPQYAQPFPITVLLRYNCVLVDKIFGDWGIQDTCLC